MLLSRRCLLPVSLVILVSVLGGCEATSPPPERARTQLPAPATSSPQASPAEGNALAQRIVSAHNQVRAAVEPPAQPPLAPLVWSDELARTAARRATDCRFSHSPRLDDQKLGENLAAFSDAGGTVDKAVGNWAAEAKDYDLATNRCTSGAQCGHYTQVVWRTTREVGCAVMDCSENSPFPQFPRWQLWVCNYSPPGNWVGERPY